ncbi:inactive TPR repeat-containing thioredoxin TTL3-like [Typha angustifolia]|uniref:inactive TPR repeat-containing thioredoxin TTL3-like n=1 Tax=Typha angustifolia TaxID=59011 RepID=UPI003C3006F4
MSDSTQKFIPGGGYLSDRFNTALSFETDKPDSKDFLNLSSPVSPLMTRPSSATVTNTNTTSSSSGSSGVEKPEVGIAGKRSLSGEIFLVPNDTSPIATDSKNSKPGHRRTGSSPLIYSSAGIGIGSSGSSSTASSPVTNILPTGNICPSGRITKTGMMYRSSARSDVLGSGTGNYGHGSIIKGGNGGAKPGGEVVMGNVGESAVRRAMASMDPEEVKRVGNEQYKRGQFAEALRLYDRAIALCPDNAPYRSNRAAALTGLGRLGEAVKECREAVRLDPAYGRAHQRLASLHMRLGQVEHARRHLFLGSSQPDLAELQKLQAVEKHLDRCADARNIGDWKSVLRESDAAVASGADSSPLIIASRAEALLRLHQLDDVDLAISSASKLDCSSWSCSATKFFGFFSNSYLHFVRAQVEMALGRFDNAVASIEKARQIDPRNAEITAMLNKVEAVVRARSLGNELFTSGKFAEACLAYGEGLKHDPLNPVLYCNRAACRYKLGQWEKSIEDCNNALRIQPNYTKALLRRAASNGKIERWAEAVRDYEALGKELPGDTEVAEALFHARVALKTCRGEEVSNLKFGGEVEEITGVEQFEMAINLPGVSVVHFMAPVNQHCNQITPFVDALCTRYPSVNFLKVDVNESPAVAKAENVRTVPTFKIYKNGTRVKEMICPSHQTLEYSVRRYVF